MRIVRSDVLSYRGTATGARSATSAWTHREGLLLRVVTKDGRVGRGEASPLPGYSPDSLAQAERALRTLDWGALPEADPGEAPLAWVARCAGSPSALPSSARFALETALLDLFGQRAGLPLWALVAEGAAPRGPVPLSALAGAADDPSAVASARAAVERGIHTVKLKIRGPVLGAQIEALHAVRHALGKARLRLDANGSFTEDHAVEAELERLVSADPELVEEPVPAARLERLGRPTVPLALDESLQVEGAWARLSPHLARLRCVAVVLKPTTLGGFSGCLGHAALAERHGLDVTVSHAFEGPVALAAAAHLALAVGSRERASGLDRHGGLAAWPPAEIPHLGRSSIQAAERPGLGVPDFPEGR